MRSYCHSEERSDVRIPLGLKARCAFVRQSLPKADIFILGTRQKCVTFEILKAYMHICVFMCLLVYVSAYLCIRVFIHRHIRVFTYKYAFMFLYIFQLCVYNYIMI